MAEYNGWTNYETWCVNLWFDNDEGTQTSIRELVEESARNAKPNQYMTLDRIRVHAVVDALKGYIDEITPDLEGMFSDLLSAAISEVNWYEIAEYWLEEYWLEDFEEEDFEEEEEEEEEYDQDVIPFDEEED